MTRTASPTGHRAQGFSLIEVLVALLVLSIGLLGLAALQTTSLKYNTDSYVRTQATLLAYDIVDRMRLNSSEAVTGGTYNVPTTAAATTIRSNYSSCVSSSCACDTSSCNATSLATYDLGQWYDKINATLPGSTGANLPTISIDSSKMVTISMRWTERDLPKTQSWMVQL